MYKQSWLLPGQRLTNMSVARKYLILHATHLEIFTMTAKQIKGIDSSRLREYPIRLINNSQEVYDKAYFEINFDSN